jgi:DnaJ homolog subfamily C member 19
MIFKLLAAFAVAYAGWWLWQGPKKTWTTGKPARPPVRGDDDAALAVLGLKPGASTEEIRAAHRRLLRTVHPDHGGSAELTRQVNAARDILLRPDVDRGD